MGDITTVQDACPVGRQPTRSAVPAGIIHHPADGFCVGAALLLPPWRNPDRTR
jgi:hypothetical protein